MNCIYCGAPHLYRLKSGQLKCRRCRRKFSPRRVEREREILDCFCRGLSASSCAHHLSLHYLTVQRGYRRLRERMAAFMEEDFLSKERTIAFDEYLYLPPRRWREKRAIFDAYNFLTFNYDQKIYNILLPDLSRYKPILLEDGLEDLYYREFEKFLRRSRLASSHDELIASFWRYFEEFIKRYRGVGREQFFYYLKEAEFRFNFDCRLLRSITQSSTNRRSL
ncbi:MAG: transposase [Epsilonproteobacteria bacterium]|nr:transposase [Campylobacterota bacterium]NPA57616.1 transposase [Campylobacterota bacterium]